MPFPDAACVLVQAASAQHDALPLQVLFLLIITGFVWGDKKTELTTV
jgi:hypothetical protein